MVIERVHGLQATSMSLNDRFTILAAAAPLVRVARPRRTSTGGFLNFNNQNFDQLAYRLGQQKHRAIRRRLGMPGLRRFGSESSLPGLRRSNSLSNLSQRSVKSRVSWRNSNGNLNRSASFSSLWQGTWRGRNFRRRGGRMGLMRGKMRVRGGRQQTSWRVQGTQVGRRPTPMKGGRGGVARGGGAPRQNQKPVPTKEELDLQLDRYMASTKSALDRELDAYMNSAMEME